MNVVFGAIDAVKFAIVIFYNAPDVFVQFFAMLFGNCAFTIFGGENNLIKDLFVGAHKSVLVWGILSRVVQWQFSIDIFKVSLCFYVVRPNTQCLSQLTSSRSGSGCCRFPPVAPVAIEN